MPKLKRETMRVTLGSYRRETMPQHERNSETGEPLGISLAPTTCDQINNLTECFVRLSRVVVPLESAPPDWTNDLTECFVRLSRVVVPEEPTQPDLINNLNDDCLVKIFKFLPIHQRLTIETVSKRWKEVVKLAWSDIKAFNFNQNSAHVHHDLPGLPFTFRSVPCIKNIIKKCGRYLNELELGFPCDSRILPIVRQHCHNLTRLTIDFPHYDKNCVELLRHMQKLEYFEMKNMSRWIPRDFFDTLPCETLAELHFWAGESALLLPHKFPSKLQKLQKLTALTLNRFSLQEEIKKVISQKSDLTFLSIANCHINGELPPLNFLINLKHLNLQGLRVSDNFLDQVSENNKNLRYLNISGNNNISNDGLRNLLKLCYLEELIVNDVPKITDQIFSRMHNLRKLECKDCSGVTDGGIIELMKYAPNLEYLNVAGTKVSKKVLTRAMEITNRRINDLQLRLVVSIHMRRFWHENMKDSPLLIVEMRAGLFDGDGSLYSEDEIDDNEGFEGYDEEF